MSRDSPRPTRFLVPRHSAVSRDRVRRPGDDAGEVLPDLINGEGRLNRGHHDAVLDREHAGQVVSQRRDATSLLDVGVALFVDEDTGPIAHRADDVLPARILREPGSIAIGTVHQWHDGGSLALAGRAGTRHGCGWQEPHHARHPSADEDSRVARRAGC